jgi:isopenicillin N synthase-like dioxygenase
MEHLNTPSVVSSVKTIDFGQFLDGSDRQGVANAILDSFKSIGFIYLVNHGLEKVKIDSMFEWVRFDMFVLISYHLKSRTVRKTLFTTDGS